MANEYVTRAQFSDRCPDSSERNMYSKLFCHFKFLVCFNDALRTTTRPVPHLTYKKFKLVILKKVFESRNTSTFFLQYHRQCSRVYLFVIKFY